MRRALSAFMLVWACVAFAQGQGTPQSSNSAVRPIGVVTQIQPGKFNLHTDAGPDLLVLLPEGVPVLRVLPGAKDLNGATKITVGDINSGDRVLVRGRIADDQKSMQATTIIVMAKADLASSRESERLDWQRRGIAGTVTAVNAESKEIMIAVSNTRQSSGSSNRAVTMTLAPNAAVLRYSPDSVKFGDAKAGAFADIKVGDQVRALGTESEEGRRFAAEKLVSGTFRNFGVSVITADAEHGALTVKDLATGSSVLVKTNADTQLRRLTQQAAQLLAKMNSGETGAGAASSQSSTAGAESKPAEDSNDLQQAMEHSPALSLSELKPGDPLIVSSTEGAKPTEVTAILVLAGVDKILAVQPKGSGRMVLGPWTMGVGGGEGGP